MSICSDIDGTTSLERFHAIQDFMNTTHNTSMGPGIGLEIGNSFFTYTLDDSFAYFSNRPDDREVIKTLIKAGYIDCLHSYGDGAKSRDDVLRALDAFERNGCKLSVWVDHASAPSNFGKDTTPGQGDVVGSPIYHADITLDYGIKFVWKGRGSSIIGRGVPFTLNSFTGIFDLAQPGHTVFNIFKELAKTALAYVGSRRFAIHKHNQFLHLTYLNDGQPVYEFIRCNNHWRGLSYGHDCAGLAYVIRRKALEDLITSRGIMVIYTHIGVGPDHPPFIPPETQAALRDLAAAYLEGEIYVTTTSRLLIYYIHHRFLHWTYKIDDQGSTQIRIQGVDDPMAEYHLPKIEELQGITFYVPDRNKVRIYLGDRELRSIERNPKDHTGKESVMIPRTFLTYPVSIRKQQ